MNCISSFVHGDILFLHYGVIRIDSATGPEDWSKDPSGGTKKIAETFREAGKVAEANGEKLAAEGEICWAGMHSWKAMIDTLEATDMPNTVGFQADLAHTYLYLLGYNAPEAALLKEGCEDDTVDRAKDAYLAGLISNDNPDEVRRALMK